MPLSGLSVLVILHLIIALPVVGHILLTKNSEPAAVGWIGLVLLSPFVGALFYWIFGINRVARKARKVRRFRIPRPLFSPQLKAYAPPATQELSEQERQIFQFSHSIHTEPFLPGNHIDPLINGDAAYPAMLGAINSAVSSVALSVYIFEYDETGEQFVSALVAARARGVTVRVLMDDIGVGHSGRAVERALKHGGVPAVRFVPRTLKFLPFINLRNHRKIMVIDGREAFIGGMNIRRGHVLAARSPAPVQDIHFRVVGPVIDQINAMFEEDWLFAADQSITLPPWHSATPSGSFPGIMWARAAADGPDHHFEHLQWVILGALAYCRKSVHIMTPYFLPNEVIASALMVAALRGVNVEVMVPRHSDVPFVTWAMAAKFQRLLEHGVKIFYGPPPFDHSKVMVVDGVWSLVGSTNWDQRSLRLNFEANLECYDSAFGAQLEEYFSGKKAHAEAVDIDALKKASLGVRLRNNFVRLFSPYL